MLIYFEGYHPRVWPGLVKRGLIRKNTGLRFCQNIMLPDELKFNRLAAVDGAFYRLQQQLDCPVYIDRLQGGVYIDAYPYDMALLQHYRTRLGDKFWGFQMHEWMSNFGSDLAKLTAAGCDDWTQQSITDAIRRAFPGPCLFLESMTAGELAALGRPQTAGDFYAAAKWLYRDRLQKYGPLIPCDSACLALQLELQTADAVGVAGPRRFMPEIGAQTPNTRLQVSYARSMAKATGGEFGVYYEPWGGDPFSA